MWVDNPLISCGWDRPYTRVRVCANSFVGLFYLQGLRRVCCVVKTTETSVDARIGASVAAARKAAELSQSALAKNLTETSGLEWNERLIARIESGDRPLRYSEAACMATALGVPVSTFMDGAGDAISESARNARLRRAMAGITMTSHNMTEAMNAFIAAQKEYLLALEAVQPHQAWSGEELRMFEEFIEMTWSDALREAQRALSLEVEWVDIGDGRKKAVMRTKRDA